MKSIYGSDEAFLVKNVIIILYYSMLNNLHRVRLNIVSTVQESADHLVCGCIGLALFCELSWMRLSVLWQSQRGKKNIMSFLGDDPANMHSSVSSPVLPNRIVTSGTGTLHRPKSTSKLTGLFNQPKQAKVGAVSFAFPSICLFVCLFVCLFDCLSVFLPACLSVVVCVYLFFFLKMFLI